MSYFSKYRSFYTTPERITPDNARANRYAALLLKEREDAERWSALSREKNSQLIIGRRQNEDFKTKSPKAASIAAALSGFAESDFANPQARAAYRSLRAAQNSQREGTKNQRNSQKVPPSGADKRQYNPTGKDFASTIYGTLAKLTNWTNVTSGTEFKRSFRHASQVIPCVQRSVRQQVMFAKGHAGKGYHTKKRRTWASGVPC